MSSVVYRENSHYFVPTSNVTIARPLICRSDFEIFPTGSSVPSFSCANGVVTVAHLQAQTISVTRSGGDDEEEDPGDLRVTSINLPPATPETDGSLVVPMDTTADSLRMFAKLDTSGVAGTLAVTLDASLDGGATFTCPCTAAITSVCGTIFSTVAQPAPMGPQTVLAYNLQGNTHVIEATHYPAATTSLLRVCVCGTLADLHAVRTEGTVAMHGNPTHLRYTYGGVQNVKTIGAVVPENIQLV